MKYKENLNQTLQTRQYRRLTHYPLKVRIPFLTYPSNNTLNFIMYMYTFHTLHCIFVCRCNIMTLLNVTNNIMLIFLYLRRLSVRQSPLYCNLNCLIFIHFVFTVRHIRVCKRTLYFSSTRSFFFHCITLQCCQFDTFALSC